MTNILSFVAFLALSVSLVSAGCDYNVNSVSQLTNIFNNDQSGWTTVPTICFAPGTYTTSGLYLTASQNWVGPQEGVDPTCGRLINPPCARYTSASTANNTVEAIINPSSGGFIFTDVSNLNITIDGFYVNSGNHYFTSLNTGTVISITFRNTFVWDTYIPATNMTFDRCFVGWSSLYQTVTSGTVLSTVTNSFFSKVALTGSGSVTAIGNTFLLSAIDVASVYGPSHFENNAFYGINNVFTDYYGQTSFKNNTFWITETVYEPKVISTLNFESNCFVDVNSNYEVFYFQYPINTTNAVFSNNYFGNPNGPQVYDTANSLTVGNLFGPEIGISNFVDFNFTYVPKRLHFTAPNVCPHPLFSLTVKPSNIKLGETVNITISFELDPLIIATGFTPSMFDGTTLQLSLYVGSQKNFNYLYAFAGNSYQTTLHPSNQSSFSFTYTFIANDLYGFTVGDVLSPPNYYVVANLNQASIYMNKVYAPITITPKVPLECYNMSLSINKNVTAAPLKYNFQQLGCPSSNWGILSVNTTNLFKYVNFQSLQITMGANTSGVRLAHYQVQFNNGNLVPFTTHNIVTKITIINHNPVINSANFTWTYPRTQQTFPNWNILTNCTDQDGDNVTVVQIQRNKARTDTSVVQLDDFTLHFVPEKVVVSVLPTGEITLTAPSNSNPVTAGAPLGLFWKQSVSFQFQITDGDVIKQYAWGIANIDYVQLNE